MFIPQTAVSDTGCAAQSEGLHIGIVVVHSLFASLKSWTYGTFTGEAR